MKILPTYSLAGITLLASVFTAASVCADEVVLNDGSRIQGTFDGINGGKLSWNTGFAGTIKIDMSEVASISTDEPVFVRTDDGNTLSGQLEASSAGTVRVSGSSFEGTAPVSSLAAGWNAGEEDPEIIANRPKWEVDLGLNVVGKSGNNDETSFGLAFDVKRIAPGDEIYFYGIYDWEENDGETTDDQLILGARYDYFYSPKWGAYVAQELELDEFSDIDYRSQSGVGVTYRAIKSDRQNLTLRAGLGYRFETYTSGGDDDTIQADLSASHDFRFTDWLSMRNFLVISPSFDDLSNFLLDHDSSLSMPLGTSDRWKAQIGIRNEYNSEPTAGKEELDTTWYTRLMLTWR